MTSPISPVMVPSSVPSPMLLAHSPRDFHARSFHRTEGVPTSPRGIERSVPTSPSMASRLLPSTSAISLLSLSFAGASMGESEDGEQASRSPGSNSALAGSPSRSVSPLFSQAMPYPSLANSQRYMIPQRNRMLYPRQRHASGSTASPRRPSSSSDASEFVTPALPGAESTIYEDADTSMPSVPDSPTLAPMSLGSSPTTFMLNQSPIVPTSVVGSAPKTRPLPATLLVEPKSPTLGPIGSPGEPMTPVDLDL